MSRISTEWKQGLSVTEFQYHSENVSLFDLAFFEKNNKIYIRDSTEGLSLSHTVIAYDYDDDKKDPKTAVKIAIPEVDLRAKPLFLHEKNFQKFLSDYSVAEFKNVIDTLKIGAIENGDFYYNYQSSFGKSYSPGIKIFDKDTFMQYVDTDSFLKETNNIYSAIGYTSDVSKEENVYLSNKDTVFETKYLKEYSNLLAFNGVFIDFNSNLFNSIFVNFYNIQNSTFDVRDFIEKQLKEAKIEDSLILYMLKNCYVSILCAFYADIIDYKDFNQSLAPDSDVVHRNLILSGTADFNRFDKYSDDNKDTSKTTRPYIPVTTPLVDGIADTIETDTMEFLFDEQNKDKLGSLQTETFEISEGEKPFTSAAFNDSKPPVYYDPHSRNQKSDYIDPPIIVPKDGNLLIDGRIFSTTIDEIWEAIKRIEFGRKSDADVHSSNEIGYPYAEGNLSTEVDTRPVNARKYKFGKKIGDPLKIKYNKDGNPLTFSVESFVSDPTKIYYNVIDELKVLLSTDLSLNEETLENFDNLLNIINGLEKITPSEKAYSLRELESLIRGLQFNIAYVIKYASLYFTRVGSVGKILRKDTYAENAGTISQLHKDFKNDGTIDTSYKGTASLEPITSEKFGGNQDEVSSQSVFMSAAGTWQSVSQFMRLRVRTDEEF